MRFPFVRDEFAGGVAELVSRIEGLDDGGLFVQALRVDAGGTSLTVVADQAVERTTFLEGSSRSRA